LKYQCCMLLLLFFSCSESDTRNQNWTSVLLCFIGKRQFLYVNICQITLSLSKIWLRILDWQQFCLLAFFPAVFSHLDIHKRMTWSLRHNPICSLPLMDNCVRRNVRSLHHPFFAFLAFKKIQKSNNWTNETLGLKIKLLLSKFSYTSFSMLVRFYTNRFTSDNIYEKATVNAQINKK